MTNLKDAILAAVVLLLQGCASHSPPRGEAGVYPVVVKAVLAHALGDAREARGAAQRGPLLLDAGTFAPGPLTARDLGADIPGGIKRVRKQQAVRCPPLRNRCGVRDDGLFIRLDSVRHAGSHIRAVATYMWTDRRPSGHSAVGMTQLELTLERRSGDWVLLATELRMTT